MYGRDGKFEGVSFHHFRTDPAFRFELAEEEVFHTATSVWSRGNETEGISDCVKLDEILALDKGERKGCVVQLSCGKTTLKCLAQSNVCPGEQHLRTWRGTISRYQWSILRQGVANGKTVGTRLTA